MNFLTGGSKTVSPISDPFKASCISNIHMHYSKEWFGNDWYWECSVEFKNANTSGTQKFKNKDFEAIVSEIRTFIDGLNK